MMRYSSHGFKAVYVTPQKKRGVIFSPGLQLQNTHLLKQQLNASIREIHKMRQLEMVLCSKSSIVILTSNAIKESPMRCQ